ncbi:MAG TPA: helicase HerA-like domain-containing protein [Blastocatellia bacterium]|nr:helicase HerA-like domain-containing protein [Blastocatellia bacterium]
MMRGLHLSPSLVLPVEAVTQTFAILAKRGVGKTYTALVLVEEFLKSNLQVVVADPVGVCWGLRAGSNGKSPGLPIIVLGGEHGDLPLENTAGGSIADVIVDESLSAILDLSLMRKNEQVRFMTDFAERLYLRNRKPLHLVLDEADLFAPQRPLPGQQRMLGAVEDLVRRGRAKGLGITLVTQRSAVLNKDVLTQVEVLVALRTIAPQDRSAIDEWIKVHGTPEEREELMKSLPSLPIGTAWFWSPGWLDVFKKVRVRKRETFDSSATPKVGVSLESPRKLAKVDLARIQARIQSFIDKPQESNLKELHARIADLTRQLQQAKFEAKVKKVEVPILPEPNISRLEKITEKLSDIGSQLVQVAREICLGLAGATENQIKIRKNLSDVTRKQDLPTSITQHSKKSINQLSSGERKILSVLAQYPQGRNKAQIAIMSGYSHRGGTFNNYLSALRTKGYIERESHSIRITEAGLATAPYQRLPSGYELIQHWLNQLGKAERSILSTLINAYPEELSKEEIAKQSGYEANGGGFNNALSKLRTLELVRGYKRLKATDEFFNGQ